jgi:Tfp pilus assembly protein PilO
MTTGTLDRRTALLLVLGVAVVLMVRFMVFGDKPAAVVAASDSIPMTEKRLAKLRADVATVPGKEQVARLVMNDLAAREKGMVRADTAAQAQAQLLEIVRRTGKDEGIDVRGAEEMRVRPLANDYGEVIVAVSFNCRIDQFVNFMADLANLPELVATSDIRVTTANVANLKDKSVTVRLALSGVVPRKLVPEKKGVDSF